METVVTFLANDQISGYEDTAAFWRAFEESGITATDMDAADMGCTAVQIDGDDYAAVESLAARFDGTLKILF